MVPCQPRQLVILSLPFAALVAFYWYKRRKSLSRSDPGGTLTTTQPLDNKTSSDSQKLEVLINKSVDNPDVKNITYCEHPEEVEENILASKNNEESSYSESYETNYNQPIISSMTVKISDSNSITKEKEIKCNGSAVYLQDKSDIVTKESECHLESPDFETGTVFHSTVIEDEKEFDDSQHNPLVRKDKIVEESAESYKIADIQSFNNNFYPKDFTEVEDKKTAVDDLIKKNDSIPLAEQSTVENIALEDKFAEKGHSWTPLVEKSCEDKTDLKNIENSVTQSSTISDSVERLEDTSTDTGIGSSKDAFTVDDCGTSMAQGQKTEEKTEKNATGLEKKLASLGLDTQQPAQRSERDSANHSPAEVMLNSPAISTFSDAHSEGSSDSGKGCSDVVTPPSRTPAGGSSVAGDQVPSVYEFVLPQVIVGRLIGRHGSFLHDIRAKTHTNVFIKRHPETNSLKICAIEGSQQDIDAALTMIRQKFPLRRFPELTLERVSFVKNPCLPISPENLQLHLVEGVNNDVLLSSLITAGHFFLQLPMHMSYQSLYRLACIMNSVYNTQESPPLPDPQPDVVCVAPATGGWYRAQILSVDEENHTSDIRFLDYGGYLTVDNSSLRQIRGDFLLLPFQAVECALANVVPAGGEEEWSEEAKQFVQLMTTNQTLQAQVYDYTETGLPLVYLYCTHFYQSLTDPSGYETKVVLLNQELVSRGFADLIDASADDEQTTATQSS